MEVIPENAKVVNKKKTNLVNFRLNTDQYLFLKARAKAEGHATISQYIRFKILNPVIEHKLDEILAILNTPHKNDKK